MTDIPTPIPGSSLTTILNSIRYDPQVCRWFLLLIEQPGAKKEILDQDPQRKIQYLKLRAATIGQTLLFGLFVGWLWFWSGNRQMALLLFPLSLLLALWRLNSQKKDLIATLSEALLLVKDTSQSLSQKTLYQIAEIYSREYRIPSLVDTIFHWDRFLQSVFLAMFVAYNFIWPMAIIPFFATLFFGLFFAQILFRLNVFYKRLD